VWQNACVAAKYWALAVLVKEYFSRYQMRPAPLWLPAGIAMFAAFSMGKSSWPGILLGSYLTDTIAFGVPGPWAAVSVGNTLAPMAAVEVVRSRF
jgi:two-component system cell cycle sensor histidine kinase PleC